MIISAVIREQVKKVTRSSGWNKVRKAHLKAEPICAACFRKASQVHHVKPFHLFPHLELDPDNLISFCPEHHLLFGHLMSWRSWNIAVRFDAREMKRKIMERPEPVLTKEISWWERIWK